MEILRGATGPVDGGPSEIEPGSATEEKQAPWSDRFFWSSMMTPDDVFRLIHHRETDIYRWR